MSFFLTSQVCAFGTLLSFFHLVQGPAVFDVCDESGAGSCFTSSAIEKNTSVKHVCNIIAHMCVTSFNASSSIVIRISLSFLFFFKNLTLFAI